MALATMVKKLRMEKAWSQEELATASGLSVRTIQRLENGTKPGLESLKALAAAFDLDVSQLQTEEKDMIELSDSNTVTDDVKAIRKRNFKKHLGRFSILLVMLTIINLITSPDYLWVVWPAFGWALFLLLSAGRAYGFFDPDEEER